MGTFRIDGSFAEQSPLFVGAVLDATSKTNRFLAMKQLFDIAKRKIKSKSFVPNASEFSYATKGAVCLMPNFPAMYEKHPIEIIFSKNAETQAIPASVTKVLTVITALPYLNLKNSYTIASGDIESGTGNYFSAGDIITFEDILYAILLPSSNTCAQALGHAVGAMILGNNSASVANCRAAFVAEMNKKAALIGCQNSTFDSASGLSANCATTVTDLLRIAIEAASCPEIQKIWNKKAYTIAVKGTNQRNVEIETTVANETLESEYYIYGGKTGYMVTAADANALIMVAEIKQNNNS